MSKKVNPERGHPNNKDSKSLDGPSQAAKQCQVEKKNKYKETIIRLDKIFSYLNMWIHSSL
jgi:hypothetical protein